MANIKDIRCYLLDLDGTIYLSSSLIEGAVDFLNTLKSKGIDYIFLTNNSSKSRREYYEKLISMGIPTTEKQIFTSGNATVYWIKKRTPKPIVYLLGTPSLEKEFEEGGVVVEKEGGKDNIDYVVLGFDTTLTYEKLWQACNYILKGVPFVATHPDLVCPLEGGKSMPDTGAMIALISAATKVEPTIIGKPYGTMIEGVMDAHSFEKSEMAMVGDRLYTDIQMATDAEMIGILVMSGETTQEHLEKSKIKPTYSFNSVKDLEQTLRDA